MITTTNLQIYIDASDSSSYPGSGSTWFDLSPNNYDLITSNSSWSYTAKNTTPNPLGWTNPAYFSSASGNNARSTTSGSVNNIKFTNSGTIGGWFYNDNAYGVPLSFPYPGNFPSYWYQTFANKPGFNFLVDNTFRNWDPGGSILNLQWFNWSIDFNNGIADLYINGAYVSSNNQSAFGSSIVYTANQLVIGDIDNSGASFPFVGRIGEFYIYDQSIGAIGVSNNFNNTRYKYDGNYAPPTPPTPPAYAGLVGGRTFGQGFAG